ncbi:MAG: RNase H family protein [Marinoscillum sp.]
MPPYNPYAIYVRCDGSMKPKEKDNPGGIGFWIEFPESSGLEPIHEYEGVFTNTSIHRLEIHAIIKAMEGVIDAVEGKPALKGSPVKIITDRFSLKGDSLTNPYAIKEWRSNGWKNFEGKPIKDKDLLDKLDKTRKKLSDLVQGRVEIEWRRRKENKVADKLSKKGGVEGGLKNDSLSKKGEKIGRRKFNGPEINYKLLEVNQELQVNVFRKDPVQEQWEVWVEFCEGKFKGNRLKIYVDDLLASKLNRGNQFTIRIKEVFRYHIEIYRTIKKITPAK